MAVEDQFEVRMRRWRSQQGPFWREGEREAQVALDRAAAAVVQLPDEKWAQWTVYFLEVIDGLRFERKVLGEVREEFLHGVAAAIADRLGQGSW